MSDRFTEGDKVFKPKGYKFPGTVVTVFKKLDGQIRLVVEDDRGSLHIFNEDQVELRDPDGVYTARELADMYRKRAAELRTRPAWGDPRDANMNKGEDEMLADTFEGFAKAVERLL